MSKLDDILEAHKREVTHLDRGLVVDETGNNFTKQQIRNLMLELIGDKEPTHPGEPDLRYWQAVNAERQRIRQKVDEL